MKRSREMIRKQRKKRRMKVTLLVFLLFILGIGGLYAYDIISSVKKAGEEIYEEISNEDIVDKERISKIKVTKDSFNILLLGLEGQDGGARSDVLMLLTVSPATKEIYMLSIPRDTKTYVPSYGYETKINHAYGKGGIESTLETVSRLLDVPIDYYVSTNFQGFEDIVDTLGGITVDVPFTFKAQLTGSLRWKTFQKGPMELNGNEALAYVRMRYSDPEGDLGRNKRQQQVIKAIVNKAVSIGGLTKIDNLIDDLAKNVKTNIPPSKHASFINLYTKIKDGEIKTLTIDGTDERTDSWYFIPNKDSLAEISTKLNNVLNIETAVIVDPENENKTSLSTIEKENDL